MKQSVKSFTDLRKQTIKQAVKPRDSSTWRSRAKHQDREMVLSQLHMCKTQIVTCTPKKREDGGRGLGTVAHILTARVKFYLTYVRYLRLFVETVIARQRHHKFSPLHFY